MAAAAALKGPEVTPVDIRVAPGLTLNADYVGGGAFAVLAKRGAGKTYLARVLAEEFWRCKVPFVALDPMGAMWGLRSDADGTSGGLPVPVFGGDHGDVPLERGSGKILADLVATEHLSMIIDMRRLGSRAAERQFAHEFLDRLYRTNSELVHVLLDESDLFAPQKPAAGDQPLLGVTENLVRRGRNVGIGITLFTQRPAVLNKDVLTQVDGLVPMRITGLQDREAIDAWVRGHADEDAAREVKGTLASLANGECWWWVPELDVLKRVQVRRARTFDSSPTRKRGNRTAEPKTIADVDLALIGKQMAATIERAKADDPRELRRIIADLRKQLATRPEQAAPIEIQVPVLTDEARAALLNAAGNVVAARDKLTESVDIATARLVEIAGQISGRPHVLRAGKVSDLTLDGHASPPPRTVPPRRVESRADSEPARLQAGARRMLSAVASLHPMPLTRAQTGALAKVKRTGGTFSTYLSALKAAGYLEENDGKLSITEAGFGWLGVTPYAPATPDEVRAMWADRLAAGARRMLDVLIERHPDALSRDELAAAAEVSRSGGTFSTYLGLLRTAALIDENDGGIRAADVLFLGVEASR